MPKLDAGLRKEYETLFAACRIRSAHTDEVAARVQHAADGKKRFAGVSDPLGIPWYVVAILSSLEGGGFNGHLHNGNPLTKRTFLVPAGRPPHGQPPFTWEESANDALRFEHFDTWKDWSLAGLLYKFESYNGFGYRTHPHPIPSPYLWSYTTAYTKGKIVKDHGPIDMTVTSKQPGAAAILRGLVDAKHITLDGIHPSDVGVSITSVGFPGVVLKRHLSHGPDVARVQVRLRQLGFHIDVLPGSPFGPQTEAAVRDFQNHQGLQVDGKVGKDTWAALFP